MVVMNTGTKLEPVSDNGVSGEKSGDEVFFYDQFLKKIYASIVSPLIASTLDLRSFDDEIGKDTPAILRIHTTTLPASARHIAYA
jgi:hypothetical protein